MLVRETRIKRDLTQQRASRGAGVSRKQWALLEQGENASAEFIQKVARYLDLRVIPLGDKLEARFGIDGVDVSGLFGVADDLMALATILADRIRSFAVDAALPPSERGDSQAIASLVSTRADDVAEDAANRLRRTMQTLARPAAGRLVATPTVGATRTTEKRPAKRAKAADGKRS